MADALDEHTREPLDGDATDATETAVHRSGRSRRIAPVAAALVAVILAGLFWVLVRAGGDQTATADTPLLDRPAPAASGEYADGTPFQLGRRQGSWVVLNFFTHDCVPCIREHGELVRFVDQQRALGLQGAEFYSIVQNSSVEQVEEFFAERGGDWPVVYDTDFEFQIGFGVAQVPETWIIDPNGIVRGRLINELQSADMLSASIQSLREAGIG